MELRLVPYGLVLIWNMWVNISRCLSLRRFALSLHLVRINPFEQRADLFCLANDQTTQVFLRYYISPICCIQTEESQPGCLAVQFLGEPARASVLKSSGRWRLHNGMQRLGLRSPFGSSHQLLRAQRRNEKLNRSAAHSYESMNPPALGP